MKEATIENDILEYLNYMGGMFWRSHTGKNPPCTPGIPDIIGVRRGVLIAVEVKRPGQKPSVAQEAFIVRLRANGALAFVATSLAEVQEKMGGFSK